MPIRIATMDDLEVTADLFETYAYPETTAWSHVPLNRNAFLTTMRQFIVDPDCEVFLGLLNDEIVGYAFCFTTRYYYSDSIFAGDLTFYVKPDARGSFLGARLIKAMKAFADQKGALELILTVSSGIEEEKTVQLIKKLGGSNPSTVLKIKGSK